MIYLTAAFYRGMPVRVMDSRFDYVLSSRRNDLFAVPMTWLSQGDKWSPGNKGAVVKLRHNGCGKLTHAELARAGLVCTHCGEALLTVNLHTSISPVYKVPDYAD